MEKEESPESANTKHVTEDYIVNTESKYSQYLSWSEVVRRHELLIDEVGISSYYEYSHPLAEVYEERPILLDEMWHFKDISEYPEFVQSVEAFGTPVFEVSRGGMHMMAATWSGQVYTAGSNVYGALGRRTESIEDGAHSGEVQFPVEISKDEHFQVSAGHSHSAALYKGEVYLWGTFCDDTGEPFGLLYDLPEKISAYPVKLNLPVKICRIASGDNHLVLHSIECRGRVFTLGSDLSPLGRSYEDRRDKSMSLREFMLTPLDIQKGCAGDFIRIRAQPQSTIILVAARSEKLVWSNYGKFLIFGTYKDPCNDNTPTLLSTSQSGIQFKVTDRKPRKRPILPKMEKHFIEYLKLPKLQLGAEIYGSDFTDCSPTSNGFIDTVLESYSQHHNLILRPDDILTSILVQLTLYITGSNAEKIKPQFDLFSRTKTLEIEDIDREVTDDEVIKNLILERIEKNWTNQEFRKLFHPSFSTTTIDDVIVNGVLPMTSYKKSFDYDLCTICGIPNITLQGTLEDWIDLRNRIELLIPFGLVQWVEMLREILDQFVKARSGKVDMNFWRQICHFHSGYGGPTINGWITAFSAISEYGELQGMYSDEIPWPKLDKSALAPGFVQINITLNHLSGTTEGVMVVGHMGKKLIGDGITLAPKSGWVVILH